MDSQFSFKDFEQVHLKANYDLEIGNRHISEGETIAIFDKIQISGLQDQRSFIAAQGGYGNRPHVFWETLNEQRLSFAQGVFSKTEFALLSNTKIIQIANNNAILITNSEEVETDENCYITLAHQPTSNFYCYSKETGEKFTYQLLSSGIRVNCPPYTNLFVTYEYNYLDGAQMYQFGRNLINGFVSLEGRTRLKDDVTGQVVTGIIKIPKLKLISDLSIRLGKQANPVVANFNGLCIPVGSRDASYVSELYILNDDIESDL